VTFLFTDIEGSTRRWEADAESMRAALLAHDEVLRNAIEAHDGFVFSYEYLAYGERGLCRLHPADTR
jgi:class 3 adenylate cyclase